MNEPKKTLRRLSQKERFDLTNYVMAEYGKSGLTDAEFAQKACEHMKVEGLNQHHVKDIRQAFGIPGNNIHIGRGGSRIDKLEAAVLALTARIQKLEDEWLK